MSRILGETKACGVWLLLRSYKKQRQAQAEWPQGFPKRYP